jgi:hypothetical protein
VAPQDARTELSGLARSIDALFSGAGSSAKGFAEPSGTTIAEPPSAAFPAASDEIVWEPVVEPKPKASDADPDALRAAVESFLQAGPLGREGKGRAIRDAAGSLREAGALDVLADSVERLVREAGQPPDEACVAMAQTLLSPGVASRIVARLGAAHDEERRRELVKIAGVLGHEMALALCDALSATTDRFARRAFLDTMIEMGPNCRDAVDRMLEDTRWFVVRNGVSILAEVGGDRAVELITAALAHTEAKVRREAVLALAKRGGEDAALLAYGMIEDPDADVRRAAAMAAGALKYGRALKLLLALLDEEKDPDVLIGVVTALGQLGDPGAVNSIEKKAVGTLLSRPSTELRIASYRALHHIGTPHAKQLVAQAAEDKDPVVRTAVRQLIGAR